MGISLKVGRFFRDQLVQVRSYAEIAATLDANGKYEGVPFSAEMVKYCGTRARVFRRADKTCVAGHGMRRMKSTVFLRDLRCDGEFHDGCQRNCLLFWKEAWLKPAGADAVAPTIDPAQANEARRAAGQLPTRNGDRYICQSTELYGATQSLSRWNVVPWLREIAHGELTVRAFLHIVTGTLLHRLFGWRDPGALVGSEGEKRKGDLNLEAGAWIAVKQSTEIAAELNQHGHNCGLSFTPSMAQHIGRRYQVQFPIKKIIIEQTGKMVSLTNTVALKGVNCEGTCTKNCPRNEILFWRESWLQRVDDASVPVTPHNSDPAVTEGDIALGHMGSPGQQQESPFGAG